MQMYLVQISNHIYIFRKEDAAKLELIHIARLDQNMSRFFYQKKEFNMPQFVPSSMTGSLLAPDYIEIDE